jgi:20S proteasome alpha/beta subunit
MRLRSDSALALRLCCALLVVQSRTHASSEPNDGRYSYSLTTFDPNGKLGQVERAMRAAEQGTPIVALVRSNAVILAAPQVLPSVLCMDDGTRRFVRVTPEIMVAHSGLAADGRILVTSAQRLAIEHEYTFDENISISTFLEELSLLFQEYTMKPGVRPFGASLVVGFVPLSDRIDSEGSISPEVYRLDPSGNVENLGDCAVVHGGMERTDLKAKLEAMKQAQPQASIDDDSDMIVEILRSALTVRQQLLKSNKKGNTEGVVTILLATLSEGGMFRSKRVK